MLFDLIKKFKDVKNIKLNMAQMRGGFLDQLQKIYDI